MTIIRNMTVSFLALVTFFGVSYSETSDNFDVSLHGSVIADIMRFQETSNAQRTKPENPWLRLSWIQQIRANVDLNAVFLNDKGTLNLSFTGFSPRSFKGFNDGGGVPVRGYNGITDAYFTYLFGNSDDPFMDLELGYFPYRYSKERHAFGDYLFRTGTYPGYILSGESDSHIAGLKLSKEFPANLKHELFVTSSVERAPQYDISLSYILNYHKDDSFMSFGAGVMLDRIFPAFKSKTSPDPETKDYNLANNGYITEDGDSIFYTFQGIKAMGRFVLDFKTLLSSAERFSDEDLKLYSEVAVLGFKNYDGFYNNLAERIPVMVGIHLPTFKFLDVFSVEAEYYGSPYYNNPSSSAYPKPLEDFNYEKIPLKINGKVVDPAQYIADSCDDKGIRDNFKWSVFAQKSFGENVQVALKVASDHFRAESELSVDPYERLHGPDEWYWYARVVFLF